MMFGRMVYTGTRLILKQRWEDELELELCTRKVLVQPKIMTKKYHVIIFHKVCLNNRRYLLCVHSELL